MILEGPETCILNAGYTSPYFRPTNSMRQGCCDSPLLFILTADLLAIMNRQDQNIEGITINKTEYKISHFADDATCFVDSSTLVVTVIKSLDTFATYSGLS